MEGSDVVRGSLSLRVGEHGWPDCHTESEWRLATEGNGSLRRKHSLVIIVPKNTLNHIECAVQSVSH